MAKLIRQRILSGMSVWFVPDHFVLGLPIEAKKLLNVCAFPDSHSEITLIYRKAFQLILVRLEFTPMFASKKENPITNTISCYSRWWHSSTPGRALEHSPWTWLASPSTLSS